MKKVQKPVKNLQDLWNKLAGDAPSMKEFQLAWTKGDLTTSRKIAKKVVQELETRSSFGVAIMQSWLMITSFKACTAKEITSYVPEGRANAKELKFWNSANSWVVCRARTDKEVKLWSLLVGKITGEKIGSSQEELVNLLYNS